MISALTTQEQGVQAQLESYFKSIATDLQQIGATAKINGSDPTSTDFHLNDGQAYITFSVTAGDSALKQSQVNAVLQKYDYTLDGSNDPTWCISATTTPPTTQS